MFPPVDKDKSFPQREVDVLHFWKEHDTYHQTLKAREGAPPFVFYEGPPTANGMPHPGHCLTRAIKDLFPRYKTMRGFFCERKAGWDTHGLPVETEVSKELGIHSKEEIQRYGVEPFIHRCQQSVWRYMNEWERLTERLGFWVDLEHAYATYHQSYIESVWWSLKELFDRGLLYKGHKIVWWWAQGGTALSAGEVGQGYREVSDPSVYVKFPLIIGEAHRALELPDNTNLLVWTTTPWTLPGNQFTAVHPELEYAVVSEAGNAEDTFLIAEPLVELVAQQSKRKLEIVKTIRGAELAGLRYQPPFATYISEHLAERLRALLQPAGVSSDEFSAQRMHELYFDPTCAWLLEWKVVEAEFVTTDSGTGVVHIAPAFGEADYEVLIAQQELAAKAQADGVDVLRPALLNPVAPDGNFTDEAPDYCQGRWVKECDKEIIQDLKGRERLFHRDQYVHDYPFCWRAEEDPLIQYPRESWFIRTTVYRDAMLANNAEINWLPDHIKDGRFGKFLESNVDWSLSRERFWGTPLPIWVCSETGRMEALASYEELLAKPGARGMEAWDEAKAKHPELPDDLRVHKPYIDLVEYDSPYAAGAVMERVTEVIDCWYDSGAMPFAQWGYGGEVGPRDAAERFKGQFPADFISEALDQTRGWFYSQLAISTMLWGANDEARMTNDEISKSENSSSVVRHSSFPYPHPFRNCIVLGLMLGEDGQKMSKSKRNYREPSEIFDRYGADAMRWYFFANQPPWTSIRYSEQAIKDSVPEFLLRLWNVYSFFTIYANIDGFDPAREITGQIEPSGEAATSSPPPSGEGLGAVGGGEENAPAPAEAESREGSAPLPNPPHEGEGAGGGVAVEVDAAGQLDASLFARAKSYRATKDRSELDCWILSELNRTAVAVVDRMDQYDNFAACASITEFVDALSNWYVRRSRERFWASDKRSPEKLDAYWTLYESLLTVSKLIAPFTPFLAESLWQNLAVAPCGASTAESVHLCDYPIGDEASIDHDLSDRMNLVRHISSLGRQARTAAGLKVRQPLAKVEVILADATHQKWLEEHTAVIVDELNVKSVEFSDAPEKYVDYEIVPNFKLLGPKLGKLMPKVKPELAKQNGAKLLEKMRKKGKIELTIEGETVELTEEDVEIRLQAKPGWAAANDKGVVVVLATELTKELVQEGLARDFVRVVQDIRKDRGLEFTDRIEISVGTKSAELRAAIEGFHDYIAAETLAEKIAFEPIAKVKPTKTKVGEHDADVYVRVVQ